MPMHNDCTKVAFQELEAVGLIGKLVDRGKHQAMVWTVGSNGHQRERSLIIAISPSDWRAPMATRTELRKMLKEDGFLPKDKEEAREFAWRDEIVTQLDRLLKRVGSIESSVEIIQGAHIQKFKKVEDDIEGLVAMLAAPSVVQPPPVIDYYKEPETSAAPGTEPKVVYTVPPLAPPVPLVVPMLPPQRGPKPKSFWKAMEDQLAANTRLPARKGYRVVPEHYEKEWNEEEVVARVAEQAAQPRPEAPAGFFKNGKPKKGKPVRAISRKFSPEGLAKIKLNAIKARATLAAKRAAKAAEKGLA